MEVKVDTNVPPPAARARKPDSVYAKLLPYFDAMTEEGNSCFIPLGATHAETLTRLQQQIGATGASYKVRNPGKTRGVRYQSAQVTEDEKPGVRVWRRGRK